MPTLRRASPTAVVLGERLIGPRGEIRSVIHTRFGPDHVADDHAVGMRIWDIVEVDLDRVVHVTTDSPTCLFLFLRHIRNDEILASFRKCGPCAVKPNIVLAFFWIICFLRESGAFGRRFPGRLTFGSHRSAAPLNPIVLLLISSRFCNGAQP